MALPFEQTDDKIWSLLTGLSETAYPNSEAFTRSLANHMLRRESMLCAAKQDSAINLENVAALEQVVASRSTAVALQNLAAQKPPSTKANPPLPSQPATRLGEALEVEVGRCKPTVGRRSSLPLPRTRVLGGAGGGANSLDR